MGIINVTPDSFSDGGKFSTLENALSQAARLIDEGAAILDIGGESTRPGADGVPVSEEIKRTLPVVTELKKQFPEICLSIDTSKAEVAKVCIEAGAHIINDVTGFRDPEMIELAAQSGVGSVVMHMQGNPRTMQSSPKYENVVGEVRSFFETQLELMTRAGVDEESVVFDPGIGFGKELQHNTELLRNIDKLETRGRPVLLGVSRKSFIGRLTGSDSMADRSWPTVGITAYTAEKGVRLHRVHEVKPNLESLRMIEAIMNV